jgi:hypothetical protein
MSENEQLDHYITALLRDPLAAPPPDLDPVMAEQARMLALSLRGDAVRKRIWQRAQVAAQLPLNGKTTGDVSMISTRPQHTQRPLTLFAAAAAVLIFVAGVWLTSLNGLPFSSGSLQVGQASTDSAATATRYVADLAGTRIGYETSVVEIQTQIAEGTFYVTVQEGETLSSIVMRYCPDDTLTSLEQVRRQNNITDESGISVGTRIQIICSNIDAGVFHVTVEEGDTLGDLISWYCRDNTYSTLDRVRRHNNITNPDRLSVGMQVEIICSRTSERSAGAQTATSIAERGLSDTAQTATWQANPGPITATAAIATRIAEITQTATAQYGAGYNAALTSQAQGIDFVQLTATQIIAEATIMEQADRLTRQWTTPTIFPLGVDPAQLTATQIIGEASQTAQVANLDSDVLTATQMVMGATNAAPPATPTPLATGWEGAARIYGRFWAEVAEPTEIQLWGSVTGTLEPGVYGVAYRLAIPRNGVIFVESQAENFNPHLIIDNGAGADDLLEVFRANDQPDAQLMPLTRQTRVLPVRAGTELLIGVMNVNNSAQGEFTLSARYVEPIPVTPELQDSDTSRITAQITADMPYIYLQQNLPSGGWFDVANTIITAEGMNGFTTTLEVFNSDLSQYAYDVDSGSARNSEIYETDLFSGIRTVGILIEPLYPNDVGTARLLAARGTSSVIEENDVRQVQINALNNPVAIFTFEAGTESTIRIVGTNLYSVNYRYTAVVYYPDGSSIQLEPFDDGGFLGDISTFAGGEYALVITAEEGAATIEILITSSP